MMWWYFWKMKKKQVDKLVELGRESLNCTGQQYFSMAIAWIIPTEMYNSCFCLSIKCEKSIFLERDFICFKVKIVAVRCNVKIW